MRGNGKNKELSYLQCWDVNNLHGWQCNKSLIHNSFKWVGDVAKFDKGLKKNI